MFLSGGNCLCGSLISEKAWWAQELFIEFSGFLLVQEEVPGGRSQQAKGIHPGFGRVAGFCQLLLSLSLVFVVVVVCFFLFVCFF